MVSIEQFISRAARRPTEAEAITKPAEPRIERSTVGGLVFNMHRHREALIKRRDVLTAEIERQTEELRQANAALATLATALTGLSADPALTEEEQDMTEAAVHQDIDQALSLAGFETLEGVSQKGSPDLVELYGDLYMERKEIKRQLADRDWMIGRGQ